MRSVLSAAQQFARRHCKSRESAFSQPKHLRFPSRIARRLGAANAFTVITPIGARGRVVLRTAGCSVGTSEWSGVSNGAAAPRIRQSRNTDDVLRVKESCVDRGLQAPCELAESDANETRFFAPAAHDHRITVLEKRPRFAVRKRNRIFSAHREFQE